MSLGLWGDLTTRPDRVVLGVEAASDSRIRADVCGGTAGSDFVRTATGTDSESNGTDEVNGSPLSVISRICVQLNPHARPFTSTSELQNLKIYDLCHDNAW